MPKTCHPLQGTSPWDSSEQLRYDQQDVDGNVIEMIDGEMVEVTKGDMIGDMMEMTKKS